jgi:hypothetical protein
MRLLRSRPSLPGRRSSLVGVSQARNPGETIFNDPGRMTPVMADINKLSVEKALDKLRASDARQSKGERFDDKIDALDEEIERMRLQRLRLEQSQRHRNKDNR